MAHEGLIAAAMELPIDERAKLVTRLLDSLDTDSDELSAEAWELAWSAEVERRIEDAERSNESGVDGDVLIARLRARIASTQ
jgi:putative addiction module component (TIGR02574 family)